MIYLRWEILYAISLVYSALPIIDFTSVVPFYFFFSLGFLTPGAILPAYLLVHIVLSYCVIDQKMTKWNEFINDEK